MTLEHLIRTYGYLALVIGTFLEGETVLIIAGFAACCGYLELPWVVLCAFLGSFVGDQTWFFLGHWKGREIVQRRATWRRQADRVRALLDRYQLPVILGFRFLYGLRIITPVVIGSSAFSPLRFLVLNAIGAAIWAIVGGLAGYFFGQGLQIFFADVKRYEKWGFVALAATGAVGFLAWRLWRRRRDSRVPAAPTTSPTAPPATAPPTTTP